MNNFLNDLSGSKAFRLAALAVLVLLALFLLAKTIDAANNIGRVPGMPAGTITVSGTGMATAIPDVAQITFSVTEQAGTVAAAQTAATTKTDKALEALAGQGVDDKDIKTLGYNVSPRYEYNEPCMPGAYCRPMISGNPKIVGYEVSQTIEVRVRDTEKAGEVLQSLGSLEVQNISGPNFVVDDPDAVQAEARKEAIDEAKEKARELARQLGVRLGSVVSFNENTGGYPMYAEFGKGGSDIAVSAVAPSLPVGESETAISVSITYEVK